MKAKDVPKTKLKILGAAEKLFAEKGFDGARVDDIAENAGVNKALIYYYFKSKQEILEELFNTLIEELLELTLDMVGNGSLDFESMENMQAQMQRFYGFMESKSDTIRIMMMESLKSSKEEPPLFRFSGIAMSEEAERLKEIFRDKGYNVDNIDMDEALIADFFTGMMPQLSFIVYRDKWSEHFHIDPEELKRKFFRVFLITHLSYHKVQLEKLR